MTNQTETFKFTALTRTAEAAIELEDRIILHLTASQNAAERGDMVEASRLAKIGDFWLDHYNALPK
jgi:hypothetical protein